MTGPSKHTPVPPNLRFGTTGGLGVVNMYTQSGQSYLQNGFGMTGADWLEPPPKTPSRSVGLEFQECSTMTMAIARTGRLG